MTGQDLIGRDTIAALATSPAPAGVAVIRVSGPDTIAVVEQFFVGTVQNPRLNPRVLCHGIISDPATEEHIDEGLVVVMPGPNSFTGEDVAEFQLHGSPLIVQRLLRALFRAGVRAAEPGEFSKRAFLNGRQDLVQTEAIADLIAASSDEALTVAAHQLRGKLSTIIDQIAEPLRDLLARLEAGLDFSDDGVEGADRSATNNAISESMQQLKELVGTFEYGQRVRDGLRVLLTGLPNAGKSSLLNRFMRMRRALVSATPGTTRDVIEEVIQLQGYRVVLCDAAGIRDARDEIEAEGVSLARERMQQWAHVALLLIDLNELADETKAGESSAVLNQPSWRAVLNELRAIQHLDVWIILNKSDALQDINLTQNQSTAFQPSPVFRISALTGDGIPELEQALVSKIVSGQSGDESSSSSVITSERHRACLERCMKALESALSEQHTAGDEIIAHHIRVALAALDELVGKTYTEDLLGRIFSRFCIGK